MGWQPCPVCGELRKWGDYATADGLMHSPACINCGAPEYWERMEDLEDEGNQE